MGLNHRSRAGQILTDSLFKQTFINSVYCLVNITFDEPKLQMNAAAGRPHPANPFQFTGNTEANNSEVITSENRVPSNELLNQSCIISKANVEFIRLSQFSFRCSYIFFKITSFFCPLT